MTPITLNKAEALLRDIDARWERQASITWSEAEQIATLCQRAPLSQMPFSVSVLAHAKGSRDWDSGEVANWPGRLLEDIREFRARQSDNSPSP